MQRRLRCCLHVHPASPPNTALHESFRRAGSHQPNSSSQKPMRQQSNSSTVDPESSFLLFTGSPHSQVGKLHVALPHNNKHMEGFETSMRFVSGPRRRMLEPRCCIIPGPMQPHCKLQVYGSNTVQLICHG